MQMAGSVWALGTMSGTSLDGVDAALVETDGLRISAFGEAGYRPYSEAEREALRRALGRWPGEDGVEEAAEVVETAHAALLSGFEGADVVGFHGQTLAHDPDHRRTHQAGSGAILAEVLGLPVVWDFRSADLRLGGQGAPLAPFFHHACARWMGAGGPVAFLNLGGVGNVSWVDPSVPAPEGQGACLAFDTGPANAPIDDLMRLRRGLALDEDGALASEGTPDAALVERFLAHPWFLRMPPKSLDRSGFDWLVTAVEGLADADAAATLAACVAASVERAVEHFPAPPERMLVTGGGRHNRAIMTMLAALLPFPVEPVEAAGLNGDMLEAQAFAYLAVRVQRGLPTSGPSTTGVAALVGGGQISEPGQG